MTFALLSAALAACGNLVVGSICLLAPGASIGYDIDLDPGELIHIEAEALGADLALALEAPDGASLETADEQRSNDSHEELWHVTGQAGRFRLEVGSVGPLPGAFRLAAVDLHPASVSERARVAAIHEQMAIRWRLQSPEAEVRAQALAGAAALEARLEAAHELERALAVERFTARAAVLDGDPERARRILERVRERAAATGQDRALGFAVDELARIAWREGSFADAVVLGRQAIAAADRSGYGPLRAQTRANFAMAASGAGASDEAIAALREAAALHRKLGFADGVARDRFNLGVALYDRGELDHSFAAFDDARRFFEGTGDSTSLIQVLSNLAAVAADLGQPERSAELLEEALAAPHGDDPDAMRFRAAALVNLGTTLADLGRPAEAEGREHEAEVLSRERAMEDLLASALVARADALLARARTLEARAVAVEALSHARAVEQPTLIASALRQLGRIEAHSGNVDGARGAFDEGIAIATRLGLAEQEIRLRHERAALQYRAGSLQAALDDVHAALPLAEAIRAALASSLDRATYLETARGLYELGTAIELDLEELSPGNGHLAAAFAFAEEGRARALVDRLDPTLSPRPSAEARALRTAGKELVAVQKELLSLSRDTPQERRRELVQRLTESSVRLDAARAELVRTRPRVAFRLSAPPTLGLDATRRALPPRSALLEYALGDDVAAVFVVRRDRVSVHRLAGGKRLATAVDDFLTELARPSSMGAARFAARAAALYELALGPAAREIADLDTLYVSPDGPLHRIPFAALVERGTAAASYASLPFLANRLSVVRVPSVTAMAALAARSRSELLVRPPLVAFGDPLLPPSAAGAVAEERLFGELEAATVADLPASREEVESLRRLLPGAIVFVGSQATEARAKGDPQVGAARYLHFATHGFANERRPDLSAILLAPGAADEDGLLQAWEVADLPIDAELVVLSACRSGLGREISGEGFLGLVQAFLDAGARAVMASLAPVDDRATAAFMRDVYAALVSGRVPGEALTAGRRAAIARGGLAAHPANWAPFVLFAGPTMAGGDAEEEARRADDDQTRPAVAAVARPKTPARSAAPEPSAVAAPGRGASSSP